MDFDVQRCTRHCAVTGKQFEPEETFYSVLVVDGADVVRQDYSTEAWQGPPERAIGWWKSQMPSRDASKLNWAPNDVMLHLFDQLEEDPANHDLRYVLTLLLIRRRVMRLEEQETDGAGNETLVVYCPKRESTATVRVVTPTPQRTEEIQDELTKLLFANAT